MENKAHALAAGIFVAVVAALLLVLGAWLTRDTGERDLYQISTREAVTGLQSQAPVRLRGVDVGKVASIGFDPKAQGQVLIGLEIDRGAPITQGTFATLSFQGVTGLAFVQLDDEAAKPAPRLVPNDAVPPRIPLRPSLLTKLAAKGEVILEQVEQVTVRLNKILDDPNQQRLATALEGVGQAATSVSALSTNLTALLNAQLGPEKVNIPSMVKSADTAFKSADATLGSLRGTSDTAKSTIAELGKTALRLNAQDGPIDRLADGTQALSSAADSFNAATLPRINRATEDTSRAVRQLSRTVNAINDNPQSLIFGAGSSNPGPGEPGFTPPGVGR